MIIGGVLVIGTLLLFLYNRWDAHSVSVKSEEVINEIKEYLNQPQLNINDEMPSVIISDDYYIGYLTIPSLQVEVAVLDEFDQNKLKIAAARQYGTTYDDDLVIAGYNYKWHFGRFNEIQIGDILAFTNMNGISVIYEVKNIDLVDPYDIEKIQDSDYDLVLYTSNISGKNKIAIFANRKLN